ncbi:MAG: formate acetyltransferase, partial [Deltaproteobacteria bacterium]|nr:formate acetyltransferase [Deltaproteobacteria bacterium]
MTTQTREQEIRRLEERQEWWWAAEKKRSKRLDYLRKAMWKKGAVGGNYQPGLKLDLHYPALFTEKWRQSENDPIMLRRAKSNSHALEIMPIFITDNAQIVGYFGSAPHTMGIRIDGSSMVNHEAFNEPGIMPDPEEDSLKKMAEL